MTGCPTRDNWQLAVRRSDVRLQWDPDHDPVGDKLERRAIQLGLRGAAIESYGKEWILDIEDISDLVREQRNHIVPESRSSLHTPRETVYPVDDIYQRGVTLRTRPPRLIKWMRRQIDGSKRLFLCLANALRSPHRVQKNGGVKSAGSLPSLARRIAALPR